METVEDAGFDGRLMGQGGDSGAAVFLVDGMICSSCSGKIERALHAQPGVTEASVNLLTHKAEVRPPSWPMPTWLHHSAKPTAITGLHDGPQWFVGAALQPSNAKHEPRREHGCAGALALLVGLCWLAYCATNADLTYKMWTVSIALF